MQHVWGSGEAHTVFLWGNQKVRAHVEDLGVERRTILKRIFKKWNEGMEWTDLAQVGAGSRRL
jgi:hypothetical protein